MTKRRVGSQIVSLTPDHKKSGIDLIYLIAGGLATYRWKALDESYNFALDHTSIEGLLAKLWGSKVAGVLIDGIPGLPLRRPRREKPFGCRLRGQAQSILQGGRLWLPPSSGHGESYVSVLPVARPSTKGVPNMH